MRVVEAAGAIPEMAAMVTVAAVQERAREDAVAGQVGAGEDWEEASQEEAAAWEAAWEGVADEMEVMGAWEGMADKMEVEVSVVAIMPAVVAAEAWPTHGVLARQRRSVLGVQHKADVPYQRSCFAREANGKLAAMPVTGLTASPPHKRHARAGTIVGRCSQPIEKEPQRGERKQNAQQTEPVAKGRERDAHTDDKR